MIGVTSQAIKYILSTHHHADHSGGNAKFLPTSTIISTLNAHNNIAEHKQSNAPPGVQAAPVTFTEQTAVFLGGKEAIAKNAIAFESFFKRQSGPWLPLFPVRLGVPADLRT